MAVLTEQQREQVTRKLARDLSRVFEPVSVTRPDLREAVDAVDDWIDANAAGFNLALPLVVRQNLTAAQKARLLAEVIMRRFEVV